ncbi:MAG: hypothetical protein WC867_05280 [Candidatus Pacearchaeota archaeon]|jgi:hypothetical protein
MTEELKKINIEFIEPKFIIGQSIYVPQLNEVVDTKILGYDARIGKRPGILSGRITGYHIRDVVSVRRGNDCELTSIVQSDDFYGDMLEAHKASKFLEVNLDEESWKITIDEKDNEDENSPYNFEKCNLIPCCECISKARDILIYCQKYKGLIVHDRNELTRYLFERHNFKYDKDSPLGKIFEQLQIKN